MEWHYRQSRRGLRFGDGLMEKDKFDLLFVASLALVMITLLRM
jgi:hypothetical protein